MTTENPTAESPRSSLEGWPKQGYSGPQPWDHDALEIPREDRAALEPGQPNTLTPTVSHSHPTLTSGSAHPAVHELGRKLGELGFENSVSRGENPFGVVDQSVSSAVDHFRQSYGVEEDPSGFGGATPAGRTLAGAHVGPWTWEAVLRAHENRAREDAA